MQATDSCDASRAAIVAGDIVSVTNVRVMLKVKVNAVNPGHA